MFPASNSSRDVLGPIHLTMLSSSPSIILLALFFFRPPAPHLPPPGVLIHKQPLLNPTTEHSHSMSLLIRLRKNLQVIPNQGTPLTGTYLISQSINVLKVTTRTLVATAEKAWVDYQM
ncbi:uncharacterized protein LOC124362083 isoform X2 [Homalodisca vitripennis]|uniref:uncharacterized protein LOC124362083 isoform X2 n=1 Tax=Homalodisca vitripennis TaxID=197043 RepID=UPI001EECE18B|nr:uncharacterized protein LOC124362083 isoform X2 [Homalodisca vitripennis]